MTAADGVGTIRFDSFEFDVRSGELRGDGVDGVTRLSPQPAKLLAHLIQRRPHVVGLEEIRELLWPDVQVEFEQSLHSCVRQVRSALGDSAFAPRYIETIPRRGYRFVAEIAAVEDPVRAAPARGSRRRPGTLVGAAAVALVMIAAWSWPRGDSDPTALRVAVMPFEPMSETSPLSARNDIAESTVARLVEQRSPPLEVVGPTTTQAYASGAERLRALIDEFDIDYVINARETGTDTGPRVLVEVIRASDGAHVWVQYLDRFPADRDVSETIAEAVARACAGRDA